MPPPFLLQYNMFAQKKDVAARSNNKLSGKDVKKLSKQIGEVFSLSVSPWFVGIDLSRSLFPSLSLS